MAEISVSIEDATIVVAITDFSFLVEDTEESIGLNTTQPAGITIEVEDD